MSEYEYEPTGSPPSEDEPPSPEPAPAVEPRFAPGYERDYDAALSGPQRECTCGGMYDIHDDGCPLA